MFCKVLLGEKQRIKIEKCRLIKILITIRGSHTDEGLSNHTTFQDDLIQWNSPFKSHVPDWEKSLELE